MKKRLLAALIAMTTVMSSISVMAAEEPVQIKWLGYNTGQVGTPDGAYSDKLLEEACNLDIIPVTDVNQDNFETFLGSGDIMDITCFPAYFTQQYAYLYDQGIIREIPEEWLYEYYPTGMQVLKDFLGEEFFEKGYHQLDGKCVFVPSASTMSLSKRTLVFRQDWMNNLGLEEPKTLEELHDMLYAFTFNDPDGNGIDDTYGLGSITDYFGVWPILGAFGVSSGFKSGVFLQGEDGSVTYSAVSDGYKQALEVIKEWYDEGIIHPESLTDDRAAVRTKWQNGTIGAMTDNVCWAWRSEASNIMDMVDDVYGPGTAKMLSPITTEYGDGTVYATEDMNNLDPNFNLMFTASATDEQVIAVLKMLEALETDDQLFINVVYGEEGVDHNYNEDGSLSMVEGYSAEYAAEKGLNYYFGIAPMNEHVANVCFDAVTLEQNAIAASWPQGDTWGTENFCITSANEARELYYEEVKACEKEFYANVMMGHKNLEADWDAYLEEMNAAGLADIIAEYEELLK